MADPHDLHSRPAPSGGALAGLWFTGVASAAWALLVMLGQTSTQGFAVRIGSTLLACAPALAALVWAIALLRRAWRAAPMGVRFWLALAPALLLGYLCLGGVAALIDGLA